MGFRIWGLGWALRGSSDPLLVPHIWTRLKSSANSPVFKGSPSPSNSATKMYIQNDTTSVTTPEAPRRVGPLKASAFEKSRNPAKGSSVGLRSRVADSHP